MRSFGRRIAAAVAGSTALALIGTSQAFGMGATLTPNTQTVTSGTGTAIYGGAWGSGISGDHYNVTLDYGDGTQDSLTNTTATSQGYSHVFFYCFGGTPTQTLSAADITRGGSAGATASTVVQKGPC